MKRTNPTRRQFIKATVGATLCGPWIIGARDVFAQQAALLVDPRFTAPVIDPAAIPKFIDPLPTPGPNWPVLMGASELLRLKRTECRVLPQGAPEFPALATPCWTYRAGGDYVHTYLGPTVVGLSGRQTSILFDYREVTPGLHLLRTGDAAKAGAATVVDRHVHGAHNNEPEARFIAHKHGSVGVSAESDGYAESWVTPDGQILGSSPVGFEPGSDPANARILHHYPNTQGACVAWYHDHALGITRLNVYAGMAGGFLVTDNVESALITEQRLPVLGGPFDVPLIIQDRMFYEDGALAYPDQPLGTPDWPGGPSILPEFFGDCMLVNGKTWPAFDVEPAKYRLRFLNGCNSRFLDLNLSTTGSGTFVIIGTEGGFLPSPVVENSLLIGPAERFDVIVDFSRYAGRTLTLINRGAKKPFPKGSVPRPNVDGVVMQFRVRSNATVPPQITNSLPPVLNPSPSPAARLTADARRRGVLLFEGVDEFGRIRPLLGRVLGTPETGLAALPLRYMDPITETPKAGTIEVWEIYNTTMDAHPIHLHEVLFSVLNRQPISFDKKSLTEFAEFPIAVKAKARAAESYEVGYKDTVIAYPGEVTRIAVDFTSAKPGRHVWHCHILEHEDHEMMRPFDVLP